MIQISIDGSSMSLEEIMLIGSEDVKLTLTETSIQSMVKSREHVESILDSGAIVYGINTGFGSLSNVSVDSNGLKELQRNLVLSHACGIGPAMSPESVLRMMAIRANSLAKGASGIRVEVVETLIDLVNNGHAPIIPSIGSLGASGDLAPLAHMAMALIGEGRFQSRKDGQWLDSESASVFKDIGRSPVILQAKEGLSLINGTSQMCAYLAEATTLATRLCHAADSACAMSVEAIAGSHTPFDPRIHGVRNQVGQAKSAERILSHLHDSEIKESHVDCDRVQDAYSFRCAPQVHGAVIDVVESATRIVVGDANSATDNPLIVPDGAGGYEVLSGGNFHGEPLALSADSLASAIHELCSISERRTNQMLTPHWSGLPAFLARNGGLESGLMILHYVSASALAKIRLLASPAALTNIPVSAEKEDHVSMGSTATERLIEICELASCVIANEMIVASAALDFRSEKPGIGVARLVERVREVSDPVIGDRSMSNDTNALASKILLGGVGNE